MRHHREDAGKVTTFGLRAGEQTGTAVASRPEAMHPGASGKCVLAASANNTCTTASSLTREASACAHALKHMRAHTATHEHAHVCSFSRVELCPLWAKIHYSRAWSAFQEVWLRRHNLRTFTISHHHYYIIFSIRHRGRGYHHHRQHLTSWTGSPPRSLKCVERCGGARRNDRNFTNGATTLPSSHK